MKKFRFSLETVLEYKQQILDSLQAEHGAILARIRKQEEHIEALEAEYRHLSQEFNRRKAEGISILDALKYEQYLRAMERLFGGDPEDKLHLLLDYTGRPGDVADPWYTRDFESTWRDVLEGCQGLLEKITKDQGGKTWNF